MTRKDAITVLELALYCMTYSSAPEEFIDTWFKGNWVSEEMAGLAYTLMSIAIEKVPTL